MFPKITFITSNKNKLHQVQDFISVPLQHQYLNLPEIQSLNLHEIVTAKADEAFKRVGSPVLVEDVSLVIHSMGMLPGPFIKWFIQELTLEGIIRVTSMYQNKTADAEVCFGYNDGSSVQLFSGKVKGTISQSVLGSNGFGWDRIFIPNGYIVTRGQLEKEDFEKTSPRKIALLKFKEKILSSKLQNQ